MNTAVLNTLFTLYKRAVSPVLHSVGFSTCIYLPTCSDYARIAIERHGWIRGTSLAVCRIARCNPLSDGGLDPVPD